MKKIILIIGIMIPSFAFANIALQYASKTGAFSYRMWQSQDPKKRLNISSVDTILVCSKCALPIVEEPAFTRNHSSYYHCHHYPHKDTRQWCKK